MPSPCGGKSAIAVPAKMELMIVSAYTILVGSTFMAWWIIIAVTISMVASRNFRKCKAIKLAGACTMTEPFQAATVVVVFCYNLVVKRYSQRKTSEELSEEFIFLKKLIIGQVAPVNDTMVFTAPFNYGGDGTNSSDPFRVFVVVTTKGIGWAVSTIDSSGTLLESELEKIVHVDKKPTNNGPNGQDGYNITYSFHVHSYDMGLQNLYSLSVSIIGNCHFEYG
ncbi:hypothetical protein BDZ91DRAFT_853544 [Kalaharituber pfeilii]|nr:hypothetical protein BDZ91DRAFT_853544 [Kalaharituber pfeilii]